MARLNTGDQFPDFPFRTAADAELKSSEVIKRADKTVFWVLRYIGCTTCRYDIHVIKERYREFTDLNAQVLVVLQSLSENVRADLAGDEAPYEIICDPEQAIYRRFSIDPAPDKESRQPRDPREIEKLKQKIEKIKAGGFVHGKYEGDENQLPAMFIVEPGGKVLYAHYAKNSIDMPTVDEVLAQLKTL
ncbi:MAG: redoxin domain-containing protein [Treponema sp.]|jgi:peroxiredoxin|nr:redoxin domain-containing protein [Treponema sp.]